MASNDSEAEPRHSLETMREEQILSSYDAVLLLLLPLATFLLAASLWNIPKLLADFAPLFAIVFVCILVYLVQAKLAGNDRRRVLAWFWFFLASSLTLSITTFVWAVSLIVEIPIGMDAVALTLLGFPGFVAVTYGLAYALTRWVKRTLQRRLPRRSAEIEEAFLEHKRELRTLRITLIHRHDLMMFSIGIALLLAFVRTGVDNFPSELFWLVNVLIPVSVAPAFLLAVRSWIRRRREKKGHRRSALAVNSTSFSILGADMQVKVALERNGHRINWRATTEYSWRGHSKLNRH